MLFCLPGLISDEKVLKGKEAHVDAPELLDGVERDDLLEQLIPIIALLRISRVSAGALLRAPYLAARRLGEPERPPVHQRVLDIEVGGVVEDGNGVVADGQVPLAGA